MVLKTASILVATGLIVGLGGGAHTATAGTDPNPELYAPFATLLEEFVIEQSRPVDGLVSAFDYRAARADPRTETLLARQSEALAGFDSSALETREQAVAFWLNAYNYFMIAHILQNPRRGRLVGSVRDYGNLFNPYRVFRQDLFDVGGRMHSLSEIENEILLGEEFRQRGWKEARVHFAVNCASVSCPPLRDRPFIAANLDRLLEENTRRSLATPLHLTVEDDIVYVSSLFDWYEDDFLEEAESIRGFVRDHAAPEVWERVRNIEKVRFIDYDWSLNSPENLSDWLEAGPE